jgi:hypothetical protein
VIVTKIWQPLRKIIDYLLCVDAAQMYCPSIKAVEMLYNASTAFVFRGIADTFGDIAESKS